jgi:Glyoxalase-like domain
LLTLGAVEVEDHRADSGGGGWVYLADPEGNEFCVTRSAAERLTPGVQHYRIAQPT